MDVFWCLMNVKTTQLLAFMTTACWFMLMCPQPVASTWMGWFSVKVFSMIS